MLRRSLAVAAIDARILRRDLSPVLVMTVIPLVFVPFFIPGARAQLIQSGYPSATGVEYALPGLAVLFALLCVQQVLTAFFRDQQWGTWARLRVSPASPSELLIGKSLTAFIAQLAQLVVVFVGGAVIFGYCPAGSIVALAMVLIVFSGAMIGFALLLVAAFSSLELALVVGNVVAMAMAGLGGAFGPVESLPSWMTAVAPASPAYWALAAIRAISLDGADFVTVLPQLGMLTAFVALSVGAAVVLLKTRLRKERS